MSAKIEGTCSPVLPWLCAQTKIINPSGLQSPPLRSRVSQRVLPDQNPTCGLNKRSSFSHSSKTWDQDENSEASEGLHSSLSLHNTTVPGCGAWMSREAGASHSAGQFSLCTLQPQSWKTTFALPGSTLILCWALKRAEGWGADSLIVVRIKRPDEAACHQDSWLMLWRPSASYPADSWVDIPIVLKTSAERDGRLSHMVMER